MGGRVHGQYTDATGTGITRHGAGLAAGLMGSTLMQQIKRGGGANGATESMAQICQAPCLLARDGTRQMCGWGPRTLSS
jgi:hypothetical protein